MIAAAALVLTLSPAFVDGPSRAYLAVVERYRGGDFEGAVAEPLESLCGEVAALEKMAAWARRCGVCPERQRMLAFPFEAAVLLHTERQFAAREKDESASTAELDAARRVLALMPEERRRAFEPRWLTLAALRLAREARWDQALTLLGPAHRDPAQGRLLLLRGAILEARSWLAAPVDPRALSGSSGSRRERLWHVAGAARGDLAQAEACYRKALVAEPDLHQARVRLARVLQLLDHPEASVPELLAVLAAEALPRDRYLAHLFLGGAHEAAGREDLAVAELEKAVRLLPDGQAAAVALSHALHRTGEWTASAAALRAGVAPAGRRTVVDPWWPYLEGQTEDADALLKDLRAELR